MNLLQFQRQVLEFQILSQMSLSHYLSPCFLAFSMSLSLSIVNLFSQIGSCIYIQASMLSLNPWIYICQLLFCLDHAFTFRLCIIFEPMCLCLYSQSFGLLACSVTLQSHLYTQTWYGLKIQKPIPRCQRLFILMNLVFH